ncbi:Short-chain dehydrogenase/reductase SDR [Alloalcanivorax dieselolei B5]|uniref:Short-chain dehydrogenase/reductase SDR n=1 Tax=Alcanivorax dieselolei (strain DSM 16502 / CGMCC 1.3690 / MCCC 1A00001 / B-5) TaxID=930169 RepID=K0CEH1_ALCDB|nr:short-chain dehydrogenase [Alloalcanivorax dieselolei]AFT70067.1 Short-chain dehydrogenase/reductase SDR [Alloalcanivorax dieselolei B5]GGJ96804.1 hypothetical protein GCM10007426_27330 [Alloalcanivorax dieselolei]
MRLAPFIPALPEGKVGITLFHQQVRAFIDKTLDHYGRLDMGYNNAGEVLFKPRHQLTLEDWEHTHLPELPTASVDKPVHNRCEKTHIPDSTPVPVRWCDFDRPNGGKIGVLERPCRFSTVPVDNPVEKVRKTTHDSLIRGGCAI